MTSNINCVCCDKNLVVQWCDQHGIGACITCRMPYRIYHYEGPEGQERRVEKPPECMILPSWQAVGRRYYAETQRPVFPAEFDMGFQRGRSYSGSTVEDHEAFWRWVDAHKDEMPKKEEAA